MGRNPHKNNSTNHLQEEQSSNDTNNVAECLKAENVELCDQAEMPKELTNNQHEFALSK